MQRGQLRGRQHGKGARGDLLLLLPWGPHPHPIFLGLEERGWSWDAA